MKILKLFLLLILPLSSLAEYNGYHIEFNITMKSGDKIHGYSYLTFVYREDQTVNYQDFLEENFELILTNQFTDGLGDYKYFQDRILYTYANYDSEVQGIYEVINPKSIDISKIESFEIIEMIDQSYAIRISTEHTLADSAWMNQEPIEQYSFGGKFCSHDIYIHEKISTTDNLIKKLETVSREIRFELLELEEDIKHANGEEYYKIQEQIETIEEGSDDRILDVLSNFDKDKLVIITICTC